MLELDRGGDSSVHLFEPVLWVIVMEGKSTFSSMRYSRESQCGEDKLERCVEKSIISGATFYLKTPWLCLLAAPA